MELEEIKEFLRNKQGYLKEGGRRLRLILLKKGFNTTVASCKEAIRQIRQEKTLLKKEKSLNEGRILIYDIETSPNLGWFWRAGYKQNISTDQIIKERAIICVSYKWLGEDQVYNLTWDKNQNDKFLIEQFVDVLNEADLIVAHNGDRFDIKWLRTRALIHNIQMLPNYKQFDTLKVAKSKLYLNSNRLDYISKLLGYEGKNKTSIDLWINIIFKNDSKAMLEMLNYCDEDVRQLEKVFNKLKYIDNPKFHLGVTNGGLKQTSPVTGGINLQKVKTTTTASGTIKHIMKDLDTLRLFEMSNTNYKKFIEINK